MTIYTPEGAILHDAPLSKEAIIHNVLMEDYYIALSFNVAEAMPFGRGCYILYQGQKFEIMSNVIPEETASGLRYTLRFEAQQSQMKRCKVFWRKDKNLEVSFTQTTSISYFAKLIVENVNAFLSDDKWQVGSYPSELETTLKAVSFNGDSCWDAVNNIAQTFDIEWWTEYNPTTEVVSLCFGKLEKGEEVDFEQGKIVSAISSNKGNEDSYGTRFYVFGSTRNLPADYSSTQEGGITNNIVEKRLHLPDGMMYIDAKENLPDSEIVEQVVIFDDIFPTNVEKITDVTIYNEEVIEGRKDPVYTVTCADSLFSLDNIIEGEQIQCNFTSGNLIGQTFDVEINTSAATFDKKFKIIPNVIDADSGLIIPRLGFAPESGDTFILIGVELPKDRVTAAEQELLTTGIEYSQKNSKDTDVCNCPTNAVYCHKNDCNYELGQKVRLIGGKFGEEGRASRIQGYEKKLYDEYQATYTVGDNSAYSRLNSLEKAIQKSDYSNRTGLEANIIRAKGDRTSPSDFNIYSALATEAHFLNKKKGGIIDGEVDFKGGISIQGVPFIYDAEKQAWQLIGNLITTGAITMFGNLNGFDIPTVMDAVLVDGETIVKNSAGQLVAIDRGGGTGGGISAAEVNILISNALKPYALSTSIPTDNKQLSNGAGYITASALTGYATEQWVSDQGFAKQSALTAVDNRLSAVETFFATEDSDTLINKWSEIVAFLNATEGDTLDNILATKANQSALDAAVASLTAEIGKKWTQNDAKISNWDSAYGWGNHANAGYAAKTYVDAELAKYVKLATAQSIEAQHNFVNGLQIGGLPITKSASANNTIYLDANLVVSGAITMFGTGSTTFPTIWSQIPFNTTQMKWENGVWNIIDGGSGPVNEATVNNLIYEYLTKNSYARISDISSALMGYATQSWVGDNYLSKSGGTITIDGIAGFTIYRNNAVYSAIHFYNTQDGTKTDVGYLGAASNGRPVYLDAGGSVFDLIHSGNIGSQVVEAASTFALKFAYASSGVDFNNLTQGGMLTNFGDIGAWKNAPSGMSYGAGINLKANGYGSLSGQLAWDVSYASTTDTTRFLWWRADDGHAFANAKWHQIAFTDSNVASATKLATPRTIWGQSFDGTKNITHGFRSLYADSYNGGVAHNILNNQGSPYGLLTRIFGNGSVSLQAQREANDAECFNLLLNHLGGNVAIGGTETGSCKLRISTTRSDTFSWVLGDLASKSDFALDFIYGAERYGLYSAINYVSGDVGLQVGRSDGWGAAYNLVLNPLGGNVAIGGTTADAKLHVHGNAKIGAICLERSNEINVYDGDKTIYLNYASSGNVAMCIGGGNVTIGGTTVSEKLNVQGNILIKGGDNPYLLIKDHQDRNWYIQYYKDYISLGAGFANSVKIDSIGNLIAPGAITMFSQLSMKNIINREGLNLEQLATIQPARFTWKDCRDSLVHAGGIADEIMQVLPEVIHRTTDGKLTMDYGSAGFFVAASLIKPVIDHEKRIKELERELEYLREENRQLRVS